MGINGIKKYLIFLVLLIIIAISSAGLNYYFNYYQKDEFIIDKEAKIDPNKQYNIAYWDYPLLWGIEGDYKSFLEDKIVEFQQKYPNINISYKLLSPIEGSSALQTSLENGQPPDIYNSIWGKKLFNSKLQIPINLLTSEEEVKKYHVSASKSFYVEGKLWGLPQLIFPQLWVVNKEILEKSSLDLDVVYEQGWSWKQFIKVAHQLSNSNPQHYIIFIPDNEELLFQLLAAASGPRMISEDGQFNSERLVNTLQLLAELRESNVFPAPKEKMGQKLLSHFWQGKAGVIAPVTPWLLNSLYQQDKRYSKVSLTLLPVPVNEALDKKFLIKTTGLILFRHQDYQGDDHSKAVYKFAEFINHQQSLYLAKKLKVLPAYMPCYAKWEEEVAVSDNIKKTLLNYSQSTNDSESLSKRNSSVTVQLKEMLGQEYQNFWEKELSPQQVIDEINENLLPNDND
ncbi:ABC transporter substrate-binding protein [Halanaerobacter jeridensis]|uniref:Multiple sugar transport system substrate-binding protein n=1 Tax=Halanaerobacter jeridensis TaxID=706427 RepID=A0A938XSD3_9FIRM|nr:extracellular solute-binding protein [Halanaerobacter jeridensis]MBM7555416.1 multiple sugar transport system substrate-binding protein [Halanaerobacter jeridensis]